MASETYPGLEKTYAAFLFDMDGTILNSLVAAERVWGKWAERHGLDVQAFLPTMHGKRGIDTISALNLPGVDARAEAEQISRDEIDDVEGVVQIEGSIEFLSSLPPERWAIVTSSPLLLAKRRLEAAGLPIPRFFVTAEDVEVGKPNPQCFILGAERLGVSPSECLVFEDTEAGIKAGEAAGADVMVVTATQHHAFETSHPTLQSYRGLKPSITEDGRLTIVTSR
ncbi:HAD family hydrolase [Oryzifoliimicrobium ureilyticus]|uniref:HAD family hydrolase n=1 Tax=Oryzifoliimicrobium ureilyticus TaxID=3113724 RepID=UPI0030761B93